MMEVKSSGTNKLLLVLVVFLLTATAVQGYFLFKMYHQGAQEAEQAVVPSTIQWVPKANAAPSPSQPSGSQTSSGIPKSFGPFGFDPDDSWWSWDQDDWNPFSEIQRMQERMNHLFEDSFSRFQKAPGMPGTWPGLSISPPLDLEEKGNDYVIRMDVPGAEQSNITVKVDDRQLTVVGQIDETVEEKDGDQFLRKERRSGQFQRSITLPGPVKADEMTAEYDNGVLVVTVPRGDEMAQSKTITIQ